MRCRGRNWTLLSPIYYQGDDGFALPLSHDLPGKHLDRGERE